jgi:cbb3-type cytochrome oxidase maturation protein
MNVLVYLVPMALGLGLTGLFAFLWSLNHGQYDDMDGAALRVLRDDDLTESRQGTAYQGPRSGSLEAGFGAPDATKRGSPGRVKEHGRPGS